jgi:HAD superfamily hydrolase (TIGR01509 family)
MHVSACWSSPGVMAVMSTCDGCVHTHVQGLRKPDPQAFTRVLEHLGVTPDQVVFVDDRQSNVDVSVMRGCGIKVGCTSMMRSIVRH